MASKIVLSSGVKPGGGALWIGCCTSEGGCVAAGLGALFSMGDFCEDFGSLYPASAVLSHRIGSGLMRTAVVR